MKGLEHVASQVKIMIEEELNYEVEAKNMALMSGLLKKVWYVHIPELYPDYCTQKIIVSEQLDHTGMQPLIRM